MSDIAEKIKFIRANAGKTIFSVTFVKKNGDIREMVCRLGVKKGVKGVGQRFNPEDKGLLTVFDMEKEGFRMINIDSIQQLSIRGEEYVSR